MESKSEPSSASSRPGYRGIGDQEGNIEGNRGSDGIAEGLLILNILEGSLVSGEKTTDLQRTRLMCRNDNVQVV